MAKKYSKDFIINFLTKRGSFTFSTRTKYNRKKQKITHHIPTFTLTTNFRNEELISDIREILGLKNKIYDFASERQDHRRRNPSKVLAIRELNNLKNVVIPFFHKNITGIRRVEFLEWLRKFEKDPLVPFSFKKIYWEYKSKL